MRKLEDFVEWYSQAVIEKVKSIASKVESYQINKAEEEIAEFTIYICNELREHRVAPKEANDYFTLISIYFGDNYPKLDFDNMINGIIREGMVLHDLGKEFGANLGNMEKTAREYLKLNRGY